MKRLVALALIAVIISFAACSDNKKKSAASETMSKAVDDMTQNDGFNDVGSDDNISEPETADSKTASVKTASIGVADAYSSYAAALKSANIMLAYHFSGEQSYSLVIDGTATELEKTSISADSNGEDYVNSVTGITKDTHNKQVSSSIEAAYAVKSANFCKTYNKYTDFVDSSNNSLLKKDDSYSSASLKEWIDLTVFAFGKSDIENVSSSSDGYTFTINAKKGEKIVNSILKSVNLSDDADDVGVSYFTVTVSIVNGRLAQYNCSILCDISGDNGSNTCKISSGFKLSDFDLERETISAPDWAN